MLSDIEKILVSEEELRKINVRLGEKITEDFDRNSKTTDFVLDDIGVDIIPKGYYFVMGDNRDNSTDSRIIGLVSEKDIKGSTNLSIFPFDKIGTIN